MKKFMKYMLRVEILFFILALATAGAFVPLLFAAHSRASILIALIPCVALGIWLVNLVNRFIKNFN